MNKYNNFQQPVQKGDSESRAIEAFELSLIDFKKPDIARILTENNSEIKLALIINLKSIEDEKTFELLLCNLTGQDNRVREAVSNVLAGVCESFFIRDEKSQKILVEALLDINPNVARNVINFISTNKILKQKLSPLIISKTREVLFDLEKFTKPHFEKNSKLNQKNHAKNKLTFNLYWLLSAISVLDEFNDIEILTKTSSFLDYTIREKTALILSKMKNPPAELLRKLKNDENIYVKNQLL